MKNKIQQGSVIPYTNSGESTISAGTIVDCTSFVGVAVADIPAGATGAIDTSGVFDLPKGSGAITLGAALYQGDSGKVAASGTKYVGCAVAAAQSGDTTVRVKINFGTLQVSESEGDD